MLRELRIYRAWGCIMLVATLFHPVVSAAKEECIDKEYATGMAIGGIFGTGAGVVAASAAGLGVATITATTTATGAVAAAIAVDCATTLCLGTVIGGTLLGIGTAYLWLFSDDPENCAGSIYLSPKKGRFTMSWDRDSIDEALKDGEEYCKKAYGGTCEPVLVFRECAALATDDKYRIWGAGTDGTAKEAERRALNKCKASGGKNCKLTLSGECNSD